MKYLILIAVALMPAWSSIAVASDSSVFGNVSEGKIYFAKRCAMCHGQDGRGKDGMAPDFSVEWDRLTKSDKELASNIRKEYRDSTRDTYYDAINCPRNPTITDNDMADVLAFLRRLAGRNNHGGILDSSDEFFDKQFESFDREGDAFERDADFFKQ